MLRRLTRRAAQAYIGRSQYQRRNLQTVRSVGAATAAVTVAEEIVPQERRCEDERFLRYASPEPRLIDHSKLLRYPLTRVTVLSNGMRVATESDMSAHTATVGVWIDAGSRFESDSTNGTAHFLEHMIFKGTMKRSVRDLEERIENIGAHLNAYTSREQTTYFAKVLKQDVPEAVDILSDILQNSRFEERAIQRERGVILREMEEVESQIEEVIFDHLHATAFSNCPLGRTILGPVENIKSISRSDLRNYISTHYSPHRMTIAAAGAVNHDELVEHVKRLFTKLSESSLTSSELVKREPSSFNGSESRIMNEAMPLAQVALAFEGASWTDPDSIALMVIQTLLGSWSKGAGSGASIGSPLARKVAENDLAESLMAFNTNYKDTGLFGVYMTSQGDTLESLSKAIMHGLTSFASEISEADVKRACSQLKSCLMLHVDGTSAVAEDIGRQFLTYGRRIPPAEFFARIDAVDLDTVKRVAHRFILDQDIAITAAGPIQHLPDYNWFRSHTVSV
eukprot:TRINITY_DN2422_c0_g1_i1.p1 TRINITY_DN2422_c0_g1~~TRINITY_DN2422_c0_g1_i1.p1  ORF type:complete len:510 (-),score=61.71 TRINITY_DN2422_c0_g1_i1:822-2351(-)